MRLVLVMISCALSGFAVACGAGDGSEAGQADESALGEDAPVLGPEPTGTSLRHPLVLAHGFNGSTTNSWSFFGVKEALEREHPLVVLAEVPPYAAPEVRARHLARDVDRALEVCRATPQCDASGVNVVAHSMGGLDARALVSKLGYGDRVKSVTTISTPHRGTAIADTALGLIPPVADGAIDAIARLWSRTFTREDLTGDTSVRAALAAIAERNAEAFNAENQDDPRVFYQSWAGLSSVVGLARDVDVAACEGKLETYKRRTDRMDIRLVPGAIFVAGGTKLVPNDGMATIESSKWGSFRGCLPADHYAEVGQPGLDGADRWTGFDHVRFYRNVAFDLAARGY